MAGNTDTDAPWLLQRFPDGRKMYFPGGCRKKAVLSSDDRGASLGGNLFIWNGWFSASFQWLAGSEHKESGTASLADFSLPAEKEAAPVLLCIAAEACITWTLYGLGVCLLVAAGLMITDLLLTHRSGKEEKHG